MGMTYHTNSMSIQCFLFSLDMDFMWELHFTFFKKISSIFDFIFIYGIYMGALIKSVPQLVQVKTPLYLMVSSCIYNTRSMQCIHKQKIFIEKA